MNLFSLTVSGYSLHKLETFKDDIFQHKKCCFLKKKRWREYPEMTSYLLFKNVFKRMINKVHRYDNVV